MKINLSAPIDDAISKLKEELDLRAMGKEVTAKLAEIGRNEADNNFQNAEYAGHNDVMVTVNEVEDGHEIVASGSQVAFIEYGTGITTMEHPVDEQWREQYHHGSMATTERATNPDKGYWYYPTSRGGGHPSSLATLMPNGREYKTYGVNAQNCMYEAGKVVIDKISEVAKEVLNND